MKQVLIMIVVLFCLVYSGCTMLEKIAPSAVDELGNVIPGTHELTDSVKAVSSNFGLYGEVAVGIPLLVWNFVERFKRKRVNDGLVSTVIALKDAADDPATKEAFNKIKDKLKSAHKVAGVTDVVKGIIAKV